MLKIENLKVSFGGINAVKGISFNVNDGEIVSLIGSNGAGKSTTLRAIMNLIKSSSDKIEFLNEDIKNLPTSEIVKRGITLCPEGRRIFQDLTVIENIKIGAYLRNDDISDDINKIFNLFPILKERSWQVAGTLSGGEQQMLAVARSLMSKPKLMMLDEPSLGLAPLICQDIFNIIKEINKQGVTILLIEQNANMALKIANIAYVLETGNITMTGKGEELLKDKKIREAYLGK